MHIPWGIFSSGSSVIPKVSNFTDVKISTAFDDNFAMDVSLDAHVALVTFKNHFLDIAYLQVPPVLIFKVLIFNGISWNMCQRVRWFIVMLWFHNHERECQLPLFESYIK